MLRLVLERDAKRAVARLNYADAQYAKGEKGEARESYRKYVQLMADEGKESRVPAAVKARLGEAR